MESERKIGFVAFEGSFVTFTRESIRAEYERLEYSKGWTFMATPEARLASADIAFVGLNPGGGGAGDDYSYGGTWDTPGNVYFTEKWGKDGKSETPLQGQVRAWHSVLGVDPDESLCAHFIPFRSPDWDRLDRKPEALAFAKELWTWVLAVSPASLFVTMGKRPAFYLAELTGGKLVGQAFPAGWGKQVIDVYDSPLGRRVVAMPHPSRYTLFGRGAASDVAVASLRCAAGR